MSSTQVSPSVVSALLLPQPSEIITADADSLATWQAVNHWYDIFTRTDGQEQQERALCNVAGHIQLACKVLSIKLKDFIQKQPDKSQERVSALKTLRLVHEAAKWVRMATSSSTQSV